MACAASPTNTTRPRCHLFNDSKSLNCYNPTFSDNSNKHFTHPGNPLNASLNTSTNPSVLHVLPPHPEPSRRPAPMPQPHTPHYQPPPPPSDRAPSPYPAPGSIFPTNAVPRSFAIGTVGTINRYADNPVGTGPTFSPTTPMHATLRTPSAGTTADDSYSKRLLLEGKKRSPTLCFQC